MSRRYSAPSDLAADRATIAQVKHIHNVESQFSHKRSSVGSLPPLNRVNAEERIGTLSRPKRRSYGTQGTSPNWQFSLRKSGGGAPPPRPTVRRTRHSVPTLSQAVLAEVHPNTLTEETPSYSPKSTSLGDWRTPLVNYANVSRRSLTEQDQLKKEVQLSRAVEVLETLFLPVWRLYRFVKLKRAVRVIEAFWERRLVGNRTRCQNRAADTIAYFFLNPFSRVLLSVEKLSKHAVTIQRRYRRHYKRVEAGVALNLILVRREEPLYWDRVVMQRERELEGEVRRHSALDETVEQLASDAKAKTGKVFAARKKANSLNLDVYNSYLAGPLPESILRSELRAALYHTLSRAARKALQLENVSAAKTRYPRRGSKATIAVSLPVFLPRATLVRVIDNTCFLASVFQDNPTLRAHLAQRNKTIQSY
ncbi:hypothetical protein ADEAN_000155600 [Angomonas deanei]|uniref:Uncharacterized protein n=1 Tax=Angomonas deanei TaxID=59799 RepID=A0A7G2C7Z6_9TRYP|nr:hypothetical protein ADEAN_000155600 [Angomonas deanei]